MATKTQTKTEIRNNTSKISKLLRGIDNETLAIKKDQSKLNVRVDNVQKNARFVQTLIGGISNAAISGFDMKPAAAKPTVSAAKPVKEAKPVKAAKPAVVKPVKAAKPAVAAKPAKAKESEGDRPPLKKVIADIITSSGVALSAAEIYQEACKKHGYWSRQSLYNALKDKSFVKIGEKYSLLNGNSAKTKHTTSDDEAESFVKRVEGTSSTATLL